jgi:hypothetical protein
MQRIFPSAFANRCRECGPDLTTDFSMNVFPCAGESLPHGNFVLSIYDQKPGPISRLGDFVILNQGIPLLRGIARGGNGLIQPKIQGETGCSSE